MYCNFWKKVQIFKLFSPLKTWWLYKDFVVFDVLGTVDYYLCGYVLYDCSIVTLYTSHIVADLFPLLLICIIINDCSIVSITLYVSHISLLIYY